MKELLFFFLSILICISCEKESNEFPYNTCINGTVVGHEQCTDATLIQLNNLSFGNTIIYHDNEQGAVTYTNVIKSPGIYPKGLIYLKARNYEDASDKNLFLRDSLNPCQDLYGPYSVPIIVITEYSQTACPNN